MPETNPVKTILEILEERIDEIEYTLGNFDKDEEADACLLGSLVKYREALAFMKALPSK